MVSELPMHNMTVTVSETDLEKCAICGRQIGDEPWFLASTGELGNRPREKFEIVLCATCTQQKIPSDFRKLIVELFDKYG